MSTKRYGFTLVELSIVLVILGLLVGGVLAGQSLIHAAELRAITNEYTSYKTAMGAFREKYNALPGDMNNAVRFWGEVAGGTADGYDAACEPALGNPPTSSTTCNGDGDGTIDGISAPLYEEFTAWQHLINAGLIEGTNHLAMISRFPGSGWSLLDYSGENAGNVNIFPANYGNILTIGAYTTDAAWVDPTMASPSIKAEDAYNVDTKLDDGKPGTGKILTFRNALFVDCANATDDAYDLANQSLGCSLLLITGY